MTSEVTTQRPIGVDVFSGAGGMSLGFEQAGFDVLAAIDHDPVHLAVHERNFPFAYPVCADVSQISRETIHVAIRKGWDLAGRDGEWDGTIDCLFGGPSCQGFSDMGHQRPDDPRNDLIFAFGRLVEELQPRTFVVENVPGLLFTKAKERLARLQEQLINAGYELQATPPVVLDAADYGVPQKRRRVFIIGSKDGIKVPPPPRPRGRTTVADALDDLPNIDRRRELLTSDLLVLGASELEALANCGSSYSRSLRSRYRYEYERNWDRSIMTGCKQTQHLPAVRRRFARLAPGSKDGPSRTSRLDADSQSQTLRAGTGIDHGSFTAPRPVHHLQSRVITVREAARLHSFPDWFEFHVTKWHALREIGNSVPPRLANAVAATLMESLCITPRRPTRRLELGPRALLELSLVEAVGHFNVDRSILPNDVRRVKQGSASTKAD